MTTIVFTHPACIEHDPGDYHPERPDRLRAVLAALKEEGFETLVWREAPKAMREQIERVHDRDYVEQILASVPKRGHLHLDPDTVMSPASGEAALRAAGAACAAVDAVMRGEAKNAFCAVRPPGHHAESGQAMGFCLFNNVAVAALQARAVHGLKRVAVIDFDVHHGNGTQHSFERDADLFYGSSHQWPAYPGTGHTDEIGVADNVSNLPLPPGAGSAEFREGYRRTILPALRRFAPEFLIISAGFDAHARDPLAQMRLGADDYAWVTEELLAIAEASAKGRVISCLEGGYDLEALAESSAAHVREMMGA
ncbi:MAG: histone deacetylase family protein [Alphaproteobacteria bacterium]|nr:histone deacetylase family protein [Alphaproteobacteria bacterium]MBM3950418.1 histone deacetylase family protein [Rhodospirillales bacterium]